MAEAWAGIVLAAGRGTRMRSRLPKMLHSIAGKPMVAHVLDAIRTLKPVHLVAVVSQELAASEVFAQHSVETVIQHPPLGTSDAVRQALPRIGAASGLLVVNGDMPLVTAETLERVRQHHRTTGATLTIVSCVREKAGGLGRVTRSADGSVTSVVEEAEMKGNQKSLKETNEGIYCIEAAWARESFHALSPHKNGEYYLTDLVALAANQGRKVECVTLADPTETMGVNDRVQLSQAEAVMRRRIREALMRSGVTIADPATTYIDAGVKVGQDTLIYPNTSLIGSTRVGDACHIGPNATIRDSVIGDNCRIEASTLEESTLEANVTVGPYSHLRAGAYIETDAHLGNYVEVKDSRIGRRTLVGHFSYIGDATFGSDVNVGAGTITCNYDGVDKHLTTIGNGVFLGSDTMLVAPVTLGDGASTGAGAVVTKDVPPHTLVVGVPARPMRRQSGNGQKAASQPDSTTKKG